MSLSAYLVQEQHYVMETVELKGLEYDSDLQDETSAFSIVLSSTLQTKVRGHQTALRFGIQANSSLTSSHPPPPCRSQTSSLPRR